MEDEFALKEFHYKSITKKDCQWSARYCVQKTVSGPRAIVQQCRVSAYRVRTCISIPLHKQYPVDLGEMIPDARSDFF